MLAGNKEKVYLYDTTLRDGAQRVGISYSLEDKLSIAKLLVDLGMDYIEGGWPGSNPKDEAFFKEILKSDLKNTKIVAFGSTRRAGITPKEDNNLKVLLASQAPAVALVGKSWTLHVEEVLRTTLRENLSMIYESVAYCKENKREVIYDAEHFFDGYKNNPLYALECLYSAKKAGADWLVLCDTNGGTMPEELSKIVEAIVNEFGSGIGVHTHNDCELAVANTVAGVQAGARHIQGTVNGFGERCGNANLISLIPILQHKYSYNLVSDDKMSELVYVSRYVSEKANVIPDAFQPFVGNAAFAHKGGIHVAAIERVQESYEHMRPELVGNNREIVVSELSGRGNLRMLAKEWDIDLSNSESAILSEIKAKENLGYQFEGAEGSVELIMRASDPAYVTPFEILDYVVVSEERRGLKEGNVLEGVQAIIKLKCFGELVHTAAEGDGPVHALDLALRKSLLPYYPSIKNIKLTDYKVRILDPEKATDAITRVLIQATEGEESWTTLGCGRNIISASFSALVESYQLFISRDRAYKKSCKVGENRLVRLK
jgi:2-isopropylmalate synthase